MKNADGTELKQGQKAGREYNPDAWLEDLELEPQDPDSNKPIEDTWREAMEAAETRAQVWEVFYKVDQEVSARAAKIEANRKAQLQELKAQFNLDTKDMVAVVLRELVEARNLRSRKLLAVVEARRLDAKRTTAIEKQRAKERDGDFSREGNVDEV